MDVLWDISLTLEFKIRILLSESMLDLERPTLFSVLFWTRLLKSIMDISHLITINLTGMLLIWISKPILMMLIAFQPELELPEILRISHSEPSSAPNREMRLKRLPSKPFHPWMTMLILRENITHSENSLMLRENNSSQTISCSRKVTDS